MMGMCLVSDSELLIDGRMAGALVGSSGRGFMQWKSVGPHFFSNFSNVDLTEAY